MNMGEIFLKLLNMSITASWLIAAVLCVRFFFRNMPRWITCLLWGMVAIRLIVPFSIESAFSLQPNVEPIRLNTMTEEEMPLQVPSADSHELRLEDVLTYAETESEPPLQLTAEMAGNIWLCGMIILLVCAAASVIKLCLCVRESVRYKENIYLCDTVDSPYILGTIKARIYLPSALHEDEMTYIIAHEKAHIRRKDHFWKPLGYLLLCVYWFHPLCWIAYQMLCRDIEFACDEKVIQDMSFADKKEYSRVLLSCAVQRRLVLVCPLAFGEVGVKERVKSVLNYKKPAFWITVTAIILCVIIAACFLTAPSKENSSDSDDEMYRNVIAGLGDEEGYALLDMDYEHMVLLTSDLLYDEGSESQAAVHGDVYYPADGEAKKWGTVASDGTAYPITFTRDGIFVGSGHRIEKYAISEAGTFYLEKGVYEQFDHAGNTIYTSMSGGLEKEATEQEYQALAEEYGRSQIVHFSYGAEGSVNVYQEAEPVQESQEFLEAMPPELVAYSDLNHNQINEEIMIRETHPGMLYELFVIENGDVIWSVEAALPHVGWNTIMLYNESGKDYLVEYQPQMYQGSATYRCKVFSLEKNEQTIKKEWGVDYTLHSEEPDEVEVTREMELFAEEVGILLRNCMVLLSTEQGILVKEYAMATELPQIYPVRFDPDEIWKAIDESASELTSEAMNFPNEPLELVFASGAGGWGTLLTLQPDGSFVGDYHDSDMGSNTYYVSQFSGQFTEILQISDNSWSMKLLDLSTEREPGDTWTEDGVRYIAKEAHGVTGGETFTLYAPGTLADNLPAECRNWWPDAYEWRIGEIEQLQGWALYNVNTGQGFFTDWME